MNIQTISKKSTVTAMIGLAMLAGLAGGSALKITNANAQTVTPTTTASPTNSTSPINQNSVPQGQMDWSKGGHTANGKTEQLLTGDDAAKATAAAQKAVPGGTVERAETDADGATNEAHMTKSDGSIVTVKLDANFNVTSVEDGMR